MNCPNCQGQTKKHGKDRKDNQRYRCLSCDKTFIEPKENLLGKMYLSEEKALLCLQLLVEGNSVRSIERITGVHRDTVLSLLERVGKGCIWLHGHLIQNVRVKFIEADEVWSFVQMKEKTKQAHQIENDKIGSAYTFTCIDSDTKLIVAWHLGRRTEKDAFMFIHKIRDAVAQDCQFQISTDGFMGYDFNVPMILGRQAHFGQVIKQYGAVMMDEARYSPAKCVGCKKKKKHGFPIKDRISTSIVERNNLTMRMSMRRMTRLTNAFSKKWENLEYSTALHFAYYNFCRPHKTLNGATPAMAANITKTIWSLRDLLEYTKGVQTPEQH